MGLQFVQGQEEGIGDVDLFTLIDHPDKGKCLVVNAKWLQHLQVACSSSQILKVSEGRLCSLQLVAN